MFDEVFGAGTLHMEISGCPDDFP